jgi:hypothetical protein
MGREVACAAVLGGRRVVGRVLLETDSLIFRGDQRLTIRYEDMSEVQAEQDRLTITYPGGTVAFELGAEADSWARRILHPRSRLDKLGVKEGQAVVVTRVEDDGFVDEVRRRAGRVSTTLLRDADVIFFGANRRADLARLDKLRKHLKPEGALWVVRPRGGGPITESEVMAAGKEAGLVDVKVVRFSDTHTAEKFVIPVAARRRRSR